MNAAERARLRWYDPSRVADALAAVEDHRAHQADEPERIDQPTLPFPPAGEAS